MTSAERGKASKLEALQALRAAAALLVVFDHAILGMIGLGALPEELRSVGHRCGDMGVFVFFVISGFIISLTSRTDSGPDGALGFLYRRVLRIVPLYWIATAIYALRRTLENDAPDISELLQSLFFIPYFDDMRIFHPILGPGWTLNFEMYFYIVFGACLMLPRRLGLILLSFWFVTCVLAGLALGWNDHLSGPYLALISSPIILFFLLGIGLQQALSIGKLPPSIILPGAVLSAFLALVLLAGIVSQNFFFPTMLILAPTLVALAASADGWDDRPVSRLVVRLGDASYATYLTHPFVLGPGASGLAALGLTEGPWVWFYVVGSLVGASVLGLFVQQYVETPTLRALRRAIPYKRVDHRHTRDAAIVLSPDRS